MGSILPRGRTAAPCFNGPTSRPSARSRIVPSRTMWPRVESGEQHAAPSPDSAYERARPFGGAIFSYSGSSLTITNSGKIAGNQAISGSSSVGSRRSGRLGGDPIVTRASRLRYRILPSQEIVLLAARVRPAPRAAPPSEERLGRSVDSTATSSNCSFAFNQSLGGAGGRAAWAAWFRWRYCRWPMPLGFFITDNASLLTNG